MRVLLTGAAGFIGSHTAEALLARGDEVVGLDSLDDFYDPGLKQENLAELSSSPRFHFQQGDIRDPDTLHALALKNEFDAIVHLAARAGVRPSIGQAALYNEVNVVGTVQLLELAREFRIPRFVFASSSSVYGERREVPFRESDPVDHPISPYAATKKAGELLCATYQQLHGLNVSCLRFFTAYGPRQRPEMAIARFTRLLERGEIVPLYGRGLARRDYTYVDDIVTGVTLALDQVAGYQVMNLGNEGMVSTRELVQIIARSLECELRVELLPAQPGDVSTTCADISHARERLGYDPQTSLEEGIARYVAWYMQRSCVLA